MYLLITIDTEEDNWADYGSSPALANIERIPNLQRLFDKYGVKPTYLITYPVAAADGAVSILRDIRDDGRCEIGTHVHPWNTPPFEEEKTDRNTMICNLEKELQFRKIESLHELIRKNFKVEPISFRGGRWGFDRTVAENIHTLGYKVDTSVSPYMNWEKYHGPDYSKSSPKEHFFYIDKNGVTDSYLLEVPATIGFLQSNYDLRNSLLNKIANSRMQYFRLVGILDKLGIINKVWLSPETSDGKVMIKLAKSVMREGFLVLNMFFHSSSLMAGLTPFTQSIEEETTLLKRIEELLEFLVGNNVKSITLRESYQIFSKLS
jgi:hypothetical protein